MRSSLGRLLGGYEDLVKKLQPDLLRLALMSKAQTARKV